MDARLSSVRGISDHCIVKFRHGRRHPIHAHRSGIAADSRRTPQPRTDLPLPGFRADPCRLRASHRADFWEVGASGRRYTREFILDMLSRNELVDAAKAGWKATGFGLRQLGPDCFLLTYTLDQAGRRTRRATIWERAAAGWRLVYHQGTIITPNEDNEAPMPEETTPGSREGR